LSISYFVKVLKIEISSLPHQFVRELAQKIHSKRLSHKHNSRTEKQNLLLNIRRKTIKEEEERITIKTYHASFKY